jgi:hypothetical protein
MIGTYVMQMTIAVGNECGAGQCFLPAVWRNGIKPPVGLDPADGKIGYKPTSLLDATLSDKSPHYYKITTNYASRHPTF